MRKGPSQIFSVFCFGHHPAWRDGFVNFFGRVARELAQGWVWVWECVVCVRSRLWPRLMAIFQSRAPDGSKTQIQKDEPETI